MFTAWILSALALSGAAPAEDSEARENFIGWKEVSAASAPAGVGDLRPLAMFNRTVVFASAQHPNSLWSHERDAGAWRRHALPAGIRWSGQRGDQDETTLWLPVMRDGARESMFSLHAAAFGDEEPLVPVEDLPLPDGFRAAGAVVGTNGLWVIAQAEGGPTELLFSATPLLGMRREWERWAGPPSAHSSSRWLMGLQRHAERATLFVWQDAEGEDASCPGWRWDAEARAWREIAAVEAFDALSIARTGVSHLMLLTHSRGEAPRFHIYSTNTDQWTDLRAPANLRSERALLVSTGENGLPRLVMSTEDGRAVSWEAGLATQRGRLPMIDYILILVYFLFVIGLGYWMSRRQKGADDYFRGGQRVPGWAAGFSLIASKISAVSFISVPAKAFATNWLFLPFQLASLLIVPFAVRFFVPFIRRLNVTSVYEYLERRYHLSLRLVASALGSCSATLLLGIYIYVPSLILSLLTGFSITTCIVAIGGVATIYTVMGGIEAVIWTDVIQTIVIMAGAIGAVAVAFYGSGLGPGELFQQAWSGGKLKLFEFNFSLTQASALVWILFLLAKPVEYLSSQTVVQRLVSTPSVKEAKRTSWVSLLVGAPIVVLFYFLGTVLYFFYRENPRHLPTTMTHPDQLFPSFIVVDLPWGVTGIVIGAIFAATMSSLDTGLGNQATTLTRDFYMRLARGANEQSTLRVARIVTIALGVIGTVNALVLTAFPVQSLLDRLFTILAFFSGLMSGLFLLGVLSRRAHTRGVIVGLALTAAAQFAIMKLTPLHFYTYAFTGLALNLIFGYTASWLIPAAPPSPEAHRLQIWSLPPEEPERKPVG